MAQGDEAVETHPPARRHPLSVFDQRHPPSMELIGDCVHCGFCLPTCPTYRLWGQEADSPRGRIYLMKLGLEGEAALDGGYVQHFDRCLGCMACLSSCPSGVQYEKLIDATRAQIQRRYRRPLFERIFRRMILAVFPHPARLKLLSLPLWLYQRSGLRALARRSGLMSVLPRRVRTLDDLMPPVKLRFARSLAKPPTPPVAPRRRVGMLLGCVQRVFFDDVNQATVRVLVSEDCAVVIPEGQGCCGALQSHAGEEAPAMDRARRTIDAFEAANVDLVAVNAAGCGSAMKEYGHLLRDDPRYAGRARAFAAKCRDISQILAELEPRAPRHPLPMRIAYHDACHLQHAQHIASEPREILRRIPGLELLEIEDPAICCGSAGIYNLLQPDAARQLGAQKATSILKTSPDAVVSGNPGCTLQLRASLRSAGRPLPVLHWIELLDASIRGAVPEALQNRLPSAKARPAAGDTMEK